MRIGIFGRGRLGMAIAGAAGSDVAWQIGRDGQPGGPVDVAVDASAGPAVAGHVQWALERECNIVIGATGWDSTRLGAEIGTRIGALVAPNFSLTVMLLARLTRVLGRLASHEARFDPFIIEHHHARKLDAPSGTARMLAGDVLKTCPRKRSWRIPAEGAPIRPDELSVGVVRAGSTYSSHVVGLDSPEEVIEIRHEARSAAAFAHGCLTAARWLAGRRGVFTMNDMARELIDPLFQEEAP